MLFRVWGLGFRAPGTQTMGYWGTSYMVSNLLFKQLEPEGLSQE